MNILIVSRLCRLRGSALESSGSGLVGGGIYRQIVSSQTTLQETTKVQVVRRDDHDAKYYCPCNNNDVMELLPVYWCMWRAVRFVL
jgi:hypothetical protein